MVPRHFAVSLPAVDAKYFSQLTYVFDKAHVKTAHTLPQWRKMCPWQKLSVSPLTFFNVMQVTKDYIVVKDANIHSKMGRFPSWPLRLSYFMPLTTVWCKSFILHTLSCAPRVVQSENSIVFPFRFLFSPSLSLSLNFLSFVNRVPDVVYIYIKAGS